MVIDFSRILESDVSFLNETRNLVCEKFLHDSRIFSLEESIEWYKKNNPDYWMIRVNGEKIGYFRLSNYSKENKNIYVGADIHPNYQGRGYGYSAYVLFIPFLFDLYDLHKITLEVLSNNKGAIRLYEKIGFVHEGSKREEVLKGGKYINSNIMSILRDEWK